MRYVNNFVNSERQPFSASVRAFLPAYAVIPFCQSNDGDFKNLVKVGDFVKEGQVIAENIDNPSFLLHSPLPGTVSSIDKCTMANGKIGTAFSVKFEGAFSYLGKKQNENQWQSYSSDYILNVMDNMGVVNTFHEAYSLSSQIKSSELKNNRFVVVRMFDEDPSRMTDTFVAENYSKEVIEGSLITVKAFDAKGVVFVVPEKTSYSVKFDEIIKDIPYAVVKVDSSKYPSGFAENLVGLIKKAVKKSSRSENEFSGDADFSKVNHKCVFIDPETAFSVWEALVLNKPVMERFVHFTGNCLKSAAMFRVRIGTPVSYLIDMCGGFKTKCSKIVINGLVTGTSAFLYEIPVSKDIKSVEFLPAAELSDHNEAPCIRCGKCRSICPSEIYPDLIYQHVMNGFSVSDNFKQTSKLCSFCNLCNSVCPSRLPLSQSVLLLKGKCHE